MCIFRSKVRWHKEGERSSKYFFRLENHRYSYCTMNAIIKEDGTMTKKAKEILDAQRNYYTKLYGSDVYISFTFQNASEIKLNSEQKTNEKEQNTRL